MKQSLFLALLSVGLAAAQQPDFSPDDLAQPETDLDRAAHFGTVDLGPSKHLGDAHLGDLQVFLIQRENAPPLDTARLIAHHSQIWAFDDDGLQVPFTYPIDQHPDRGPFKKVVVYYEIPSGGNMAQLQKSELPAPWPDGREVPIFWPYPGWLEIHGPNCAIARHFHWREGFKSVRFDMFHVLCLD